MTRLICTGEIYFLVENHFTDIYLYMRWNMIDFRQYIFRPASKECTESASHQTQGIQFYVTPNRILLLDTQVYI